MCCGYVDVVYRMEKLTALLSVYQALAAKKSCWCHLVKWETSTNTACWQTLSALAWIPVGGSSGAMSLG